MEFEQSTASSSLQTSKATHEEDASIILVGMTGAGKKTLAVITSLALNRRYVNFATYFKKQNGIPPTAHLQQYGLESYRLAEVETARILFENCRRGCVVEGLSDVGNDSLRTLLRVVGSRNPIIYIRRSPKELRKFVNTDDGRFASWYKFRDAFHVSCSTHDFYNLSVVGEIDESHGTVTTLKLKDAELDFVRFLHRLFGRSSRLLYSADPLSSSYTYALNVPLTWLETCTDFTELDCGADAINLLIDAETHTPGLHDRVAKRVALLRRKTRVPIMFEVFYDSQHPSAYFALLRIGLRCLPDMIVVDLRADASQVSSILSMNSNVKKIGALHFETPWPIPVSESLQSSLYSKAKDLPCDAIRVTHHAESGLDNSKCMTFAHEMTQRLDIPVIAYNTGKYGRTSVCLNPILSPTMPSSIASRSSKGITVKQAQSATYSCFIATKKAFTIFGSSVSDSLSPAMHNAAFQAVGMPHTYDLFQSDSFSQIHQLLQNAECRGVAVTLPYKTDVLRLLDFVSDDAREIGAVNTVTIEHRSRTVGSTKNTVTGAMLRGYNTDHIAIRECIYRKLSPANLVRTNTSALILGAGGMARAALYACHALGVRNFAIHNRTIERAENLARTPPWSSSSSARVNILHSLEDEWPSDLLPQQPTIIISTLPADGIGGNPAHELTIPEKWLQSRTGGVFVEVAYNPIITRFMKQIQPLTHSKGWVIVDGLELLVEQGIAQFEIFTGRPAPLHVMRRVVCERRRLYLQQQDDGS